MMKEGTIIKELGEYILQCHPRWIIRKRYYCRMQNAILSVKNLYDCYDCPLLGGFTQGEQQGLPECYYYDFDLPDKYLSPQAEKKRIDHQIKYHGVPKIPER